MNASKIVVATDFSDTADHALDYALTFAALTGARITIVHAYGLPVYGFPDGVLLPNPEVAANISNVAQQALDRTVQRAREHYPSVEGVLRDGDPREEVEKVAEEIGANLIVLGTHGRRGFKRWLLGSVSERVVRTSDIPVLTVPDGGDGA